MRRFYQLLWEHLRRRSQEVFTSIWKIFESTRHSGNQPGGEHHHSPFMQESKDPPSDEKSENRLYVGNLDQRITEATILKMFSPFGTIISEDFLWHTCGPKRGEPRGYAFIQYSTKEEAELARSKMNGRLACGRPLVVHFAHERFSMEVNTVKVGGGGIDRKNRKTGDSTGSSAAQSSRTATIAAIRGKLKSIEDELSRGGKKKLRLLEKKADN